MVFNHAPKSITRKVPGPGVEPVVVIVLSVTMLLIFFFNVCVQDQRPGLLSTLVKEVSFYSGRQYMKTCLHGQNTKNKRLSILSPKGEIYTSLLQCAQGTSWQRGQKGCFNQRMYRRAMTCCLGHEKVEAIISQGGCACLHRTI